MTGRGARQKVGGQFVLLWRTVALNESLLSVCLPETHEGLKEETCSNFISSVVFVILFKMARSWKCLRDEQVLVSDYGSEGLEKKWKTETKTILDDLKMPKPIASASFLSSLSIIHDDTRSQLLGRFLPVQAWIIDLVTVFDAILTSRQTCERSQCLYENLTSYNFRKTAVLKKISIVN